MRPSLVVALAGGLGLIACEHGFGWPWSALFTGFIIGIITVHAGQWLDERAERKMRG